MAMGHLGICMQRKSFNLYLTPYAEINKQWVTDLNAKSKIITFIEENSRGNVCDSGLGKDYYYYFRYYNPG